MGQGTMQDASWFRFAHRPCSLLVGAGTMHCGVSACVVHRCAAIAHRLAPGTPPNLPCPCAPAPAAVPLPPQNAKYAVSRDVLPDGTVVPAGTQVIYSAYVVNRLARVWGPDALSFRPERWLEMDKAPSPYAYLTFNAGARVAGLGGVLSVAGWS